MNSKSYLTVNELNSYIKKLLENDQQLKYVDIRGEISNFVAHSSGHFYFSLIDKDSSVSCVMFANYARNVDRKVKNGDDVIIRGYCTVFTKRGQYQLNVFALQHFGEGEQLLKLKELKDKLTKEGIFDVSRKRQINRFPKRIGLITARESAACADLIENIQRRYSNVEILVFNSIVQGENAPESLINSFKKTTDYNLDTIIVARGGGSNEDLNAFNNEKLVRYIADIDVPVIAAIGHEIDFTLVDYVADVRASTPTGAAELAVIDKYEVLDSLSMYKSKLNSLVVRKYTHLKDKVEMYKNLGMFLRPENIYSNKLEKLEDIKSRLFIAVSNNIKLKKEYVMHKQQLLKGLNVTTSLNRGYSITSTNNKIITSVKDVDHNETIQTKLKDGIIISKVIGKE